VLPSAAATTLYPAIAGYAPMAVGDAAQGGPRTPGASGPDFYSDGYSVRPGEPFAGPVARGDQGAFRIDGFEIGGAASPGAPSGTLDAIAQGVETTAGGADVVALSPGPQVNLVERRGTNEWRASGLAAGSGGALAAGAASPAGGLPSDQAASERVTGDRVRSTGALAGEAGGPLLRGLLWGWGGLDHDRTSLSAFGGQPFTLADASGAAKLDAHVTEGNSAALSFTHASQDGTDVGAGPERSPGTLLDDHAWTQVLRLADLGVVSPRLYFSATAGTVGSGSRQQPNGGLTSPLYVDAAGVAYGSWYADTDHRSTGAGTAEAAGSGRLFGGDNEAKIGGEWRRTTEDATWQAPLWAQITAGELLGLAPGLDALDIWRDGNTRDAVTRQGLWVADTVSWSRLTASFGLRYDLQTPRNLASIAPAVPGDPLLPAVAFAGNDAGGVRWQSLAPRIGLVAAPLRSLQLRASLARYASPLTSDVPLRLNPAAPAAAGYRFPGSGYVEGGDAEGAAFWYPAGFDPALPSNVPANAIDPHLRPEMTDEAILGGAYALGPEGGLDLQLVWRRVTGILEDRLLVRDAATQAVGVATAADWVPAGAVAGNLPDGSPYSVPYYDLRPGLAPTGGALLVNGDRQQQLLGATLGWHQRFARRFTLRGRVTLQSWTWKIGPDYRRYADPTPALVDGNYPGEPVGVPGATPGGLPLYVVPPWSFDLGGAVDLPWGLAAAAQLAGRAGLPLAWYRMVARDDAGPIDVRVGDVDSYRTDALVSLDARLEKRLRALSDLDASLSLEALNLLNAGQVLRREADLGATRAGYVDQVVTPRLLRLGLRLRFR
jgi:hypothetical protein